MRSQDNGPKPDATGSGAEPAEAPAEATSAKNHDSMNAHVTESWGKYTMRTEGWNKDIVDSQDAKIGFLSANRVENGERVAGRFEEMAGGGLGFTTAQVNQIYENASVNGKAGYDGGSVLPGLDPNYNAGYEYTRMRLEAGDNVHGAMKYHTEVRNGMDPQQAARMHDIALDDNNNPIFEFSIEGKALDAHAGGNQDYVPQSHLQGRDGKVEIMPAKEVANEVIRAFEDKKQVDAERAIRALRSLAATKEERDEFKDHFEKVMRKSYRAYLDEMLERRGSTDIDNWAADKLNWVAEKVWLGGWIGNAKIIDAFSHEMLSRPVYGVDPAATAELINEADGTWGFGREPELADRLLEGLTAAEIKEVQRHYGGDLAHVMISELPGTVDEARVVVALRVKPEDKEIGEMIVALLEAAHTSGGHGVLPLLKRFTEDAPEGEEVSLDKFKAVYKRAFGRDFALSSFGDPLARHIYDRAQERLAGGFEVGLVSNILRMNLGLKRDEIKSFLDELRSAAWMPKYRDVTEPRVLATFQDRPQGEAAQIWQAVRGEFTRKLLSEDAEYAPELVGKIAYSVIPDGDPTFSADLAYNVGLLGGLLQGEEDSRGHIRFKNQHAPTTIAAIAQHVNSGENPEETIQKLQQGFKDFFGLELAEGLAKRFQGNTLLAMRKAYGLEEAEAGPAGD